MHRNRCKSSVVVTKLLMRTTLPNFDEPYFLQNPNDFAGFENGQFNHFNSRQWIVFQRIPLP